MSDERFTAPLCIPMMAPAMNTRTDEHFRYRELARQKARVERSIGLERLPRLMDRSAPGNGSATAILVSLTFHLDGEGDVWAVGEVQWFAAASVSGLCGDTRVSAVSPHRALPGQL